MIKNILYLGFLSLFSINLFANKALLPIFDYQSVYHPTIGTGGMVVSQRKLASQVGAEILAKGGNAVINIRSFYKKNEMSSETKFECHVGLLMAGVALKGTVVYLD